jgi:hypothetical protein
VLAQQSRLYATALAAQLSLILLGIVGCAPAFRRIGIVAVAHYFCLVQSAAAVGFIRGMFGRQTVLWQRFARPQPASQGVHL